MQIKWENILAMGLSLILVILLMSNWTEIWLFVHHLGHIGPGSTTEERTLGLIALGLIGAILVALVRILTRDKS